MTDGAFLSNHGGRSDSKWGGDEQGGMASHCTGNKTRGSVVGGE